MRQQETPLEVIARSMVAQVNVSGKANLWLPDRADLQAVETILGDCYHGISVSWNAKKTHLIISSSKQTAA
jgi:hypothetical protein